MTSTPADSGPSDLPSTEATSAAPSAAKRRQRRAGTSPAATPPANRAGPSDFSDPAVRLEAKRALIWLGCADPCSSMEQARDDDPELGELRELLDAWRNEFGIDLAPTVGEIIGMIGERFPDEADGAAGAHKFPRMRELLTRTCTMRNGVDSMRMSNLFRAKEGRIVMGHKLRKAAKAGNVVRWQVRPV